MYTNTKYNLFCLCWLGKHIVYTIVSHFLHVASLVFWIYVLLRQVVGMNVIHLSEKTKVTCHAPRLFGIFGEKKCNVVYKI